MNHDFSLFTASDEDKKKRISPQLAFALFQYLSTGIPIFLSALNLQNFKLKDYQLIGPYCLARVNNDMRKRLLCPIWWRIPPLISANFL